MTFYNAIQQGDYCAAELARRVERSQEKWAAAKAELPALVSVTVKSAAGGASIEVDGVVVGTTPGTIQVRPGIHEVRVTREGYATWEKSVAFYDGQMVMNEVNPHCADCREYKGSTAVKPDYW